jgi:hypothetical protein
MEKKQVQLISDLWNFSKVLQVSCFAEKSESGYVTNASIITIRDYKKDGARVEISFRPQEILEFAFGLEELIGMSTYFASQYRDNKAQNNGSQNTEKQKDGYTKTTAPGADKKTFALKYTFKNGNSSFYINVFSPDYPEPISIALNKYEVRSLSHGLKLLYDENKKAYYDYIRNKL